ncbi:MAG TPA: AarF/UbiB family protein [Vicinamibacteria bacterium]|nr:AarF/UbiB family protein [Vicinamibacteria bacterium]
MSLLAAGDGKDRRSRLDRNTRRLREILGVAVRYGLAEQFRRLPGKQMQRWLRGSAGQNLMELGAPVRLRLALTELGTTFIKFGQMLSTRADLVGQDVALELAHLQSDTAPDPPGVAEATIERELGGAPEAVFASFAPRPFASASIAQVHHARLRTGENVVVKVQHEGIEPRIESDLAILADLALLAGRHVRPLRLYHPVAVVRQFTRMMRAELDFVRELRNLEQFRRNFAADETVHFPVPFPDLCTRRVLTMERLEGVLVSQVQRLPGPNAEMDEFVRRGANVYLEMIFRDSFYHADPHPGNLMVLPDQVVGVLDCGMVQWLEEDLREVVEDLLLGLARNDARTMADAVWDLCTSPPSGGRQRLHSDVADLVADYAAETVGGLDIGAVLNSLTEIIHRNHLFLPPGVSLLLRMLAELEGTAKQLNPSFQLVELVKPYAERAALHRFAPGRVWLEVQRGVREWERLARAVPGDLNDLLRRLRAGTFSVHLEHRRLDPVVNRLVLGLLTSSLLLGSSLLWSMHAEPLVRGVSLFGTIGYALALVMGVTLLRRIRRSERPREDR